MTDAARLHRDAVVVDCHNDLMLLVARDRALGRPDTFRTRWIADLRAGGVDVVVLAVFIEHEYLPEGALRRSLHLVELVHQEAESNADDVALCLTGADIEAAVGSGRIALVLALEGSAGVGGDPDLFRTFHRLGVRMASFSWFGRTALADGSGEQDTGGRLTKAGVASLRLMEELGIVMDVSHLSVAGTQHVLDIATRPVIASHSSARALVDHHRNLTDEQLKAIAQTGGVVGVNFFAGFVDPERPSVDRLVDHIVHIASVAGIDHVGLGPDFVEDYFEAMYPSEPDLVIEGMRARDTIGLDRPSELPRLTEALVRRGLHEDEVRKVLGENLMRVFREVMGRP